MSNFVRSVDEADCPDFIDHTRGPSGYNQWHDWARKMGRTHRQVKCAGCGLYAIWIPKVRAPLTHRERE